MKALAFTLSAAALLALVTTPVMAGGPNDFFGSSVGNPDNSPGTMAANNALNAANNSQAPDYTGDEKRMQKKYKENVKCAEKLIAKGEAMLKDKDVKTAKKGKIFKEIGERRLAELKANSPLQQVAGDPSKNTQ